jgi:hypothetical protein
MNQYTLAQIKQKVQQPLDLEEEIFIRPTELLDNINEAIRDAEAKIHTIYEDYFLTSATISLVAGTSEYDLPTDMYANKIRGFVYADGSDYYPVLRLRKFDLIPYITSEEPYNFIIKNYPTGKKLVIFPASRITSSTALTCWYLRNAKQLVNDTDVCDIPEFVNYIVQKTKVLCMQKEGHPLLESAEKKLMDEDKLMVETLTVSIPDEDNRISMDLSSYEELS